MEHPPIQKPKTDTKSAEWTLYIIQSCKGTYYTGITLDINRRFKEHQAQGSKCAKYLRGKAPLKLVFSYKIGQKSVAMKMERRIKNLGHAEKKEIINNQDRFFKILQTLTVRRET